MAKTVREENIMSIVSGVALFADEYAAAMQRANKCFSEGKEANIKMGKLSAELSKHNADFEMLRENNDDIILVDRIRVSMINERFKELSETFERLPVVSKELKKIYKENTKYLDKLNESNLGYLLRLDRLAVGKVKEADQNFKVCMGELEKRYKVIDSLITTARKIKKSTSKIFDKYNRLVDGRSKNGTRTGKALLDDFTLYQEFVPSQGSQDNEKVVVPDLVVTPDRVVVPDLVVTPDRVVAPDLVVTPDLHVQDFDDGILKKEEVIAPTPKIGLAVRLSIQRLLDNQKELSFFKESSAMVVKKEITPLDLADERDGSTRGIHNVFATSPKWTCENDKKSTSSVNKDLVKEILLKPKDHQKIEKRKMAL